MSVTRRSISNSAPRRLRRRHLLGSKHVAGAAARRCRSVQKASKGQNSVDTLSAIEIKGRFTLEPREVNITGRKRTRVVTPRAVSITTIIISMKKKSASQFVRRNFRQGGFFKLRVFIGVLLCFAGVDDCSVCAWAKRQRNHGHRQSNANAPWNRFPAANKIAPWVMEHTANGQKAEFLVVLADQADLSGAASLPTKVEKGRFVYQTLLEKAQTTQDPILQWLRDRNISYQSFYIVNAILVKGTREIADALAARPEVARIEGNPLIHNDLPQPGPVEQSPLQPRGPGAPATIEPGIVYTHAPDVWTLGFKGETIVVASADTGVRWTHNALKPHYRGWDGVTANHNFNWHDSIHDSVGNPCGNDSQQPCDDFFHGSHTTGTAIGDDGGTNQIGMAPGARWIACRNMDEGNGTPARYIECMEFFLAPYPLNCTPNEGDPTKAPDITINSWGCPDLGGLHNRRRTASRG